MTFLNKAAALWKEPRPNSALPLSMRDMISSWSFRVFRTPWQSPPWYCTAAMLLRSRGSNPSVDLILPIVSKAVCVNPVAC